ncbi:hypothetical protein HU200_032993 [Digitaria exilis]|uniref:Protein kinase domain-containing protein n=1 Tax=Digitaria exilis TaxID=1010633 RepID=A0A835BNL6_9POAL|nr:hypothetical protein HU200_032993 [Digitaria exilis]
MAMVMKAPTKTLLLFYLLCVTTLSHATSLSFNYNFSTPGDLTSADLRYISNATAAGDRVDLTKNTTWSTGRLAYEKPVQLWDDSTGKVASFTSNFTFVIRPRNSTAQADGMAFFVGTYPPTLPQDSNGGFLGLVNNPNNPANTIFPPTVAVEFDALRNTWDPNDTINHVGVDVNSVTSTVYTALPDGCFNGTMSAWVKYDANTSTLSATLRFGDLPELGVYNVSAPVDFRAAGLPQQAAVGFSAATGAFAFDSTLTTVAAFLKRKGTKQKQNAPLDGDMDDEFEKGTGPRKFTYRQLSQATRGFSEDEKLGEGGFGSVYRGFLQDQGLHVAIKRVSKTSKQGRREYISEVTIIGRLRHRNLVQLLGWCHETDELLLVYELMTNGSLDTHLYSTINHPTYNIILGMGSALLYLHQECEQCVVHRDIKPSNVMLDSSFNAKLGDFGLARLVNHGRDERTTMVAGTKGYIDPDARSDVYSFGVLLLEIACGRKPVDLQEEDESRVLLVQWVWALYGRGELLDAVDARLRDDGEELDAMEAERALVVGLWCVHPDNASRATIRQAMNVLHFEAPLPELPLEMPVAMYGARAVGGSVSSNTTTSSSSSGSVSTNSGGHSLASDRTAARSSASSEKMSSAARETRLAVGSNTRNESNSGRSGMVVDEQFQSTR